MGGFLNRQLSRERKKCLSRDVRSEAAKCKMKYKNNLEKLFISGNI